MNKHSNHLTVSSTNRGECPSGSLESKMSVRPCRNSGFSGDERLHPRSVTDRSRTSWGGAFSKDARKREFGVARSEKPGMPLRGADWKRRKPCDKHDLRLFYILSARRLAFEVCPPLWKMHAGFVFPEFYNPNTFNFLPFKRIFHMIPMWPGSGFFLCSPLSSEFSPLPLDYVAFSKTFSPSPSMCIH